MKLFYKPGACSLASHIALQEIGAEFALEAVDTALGQTEQGKDYAAINPKGYVPALQLADGNILTEGPAILQYLADGDEEQRLTAPVGTLERARMLEHLTFVSSELHKAFGPLFQAGTSEADAQRARVAVGQKFDVVEAHLEDGRIWLGKHFTIADAYLFVVANWANFTGIPLGDWPNLSGFVARVAERPAVQRAMGAEGLLP